MKRGAHDTVLDPRRGGWLGEGEHATRCSTLEKANGSPRRRAEEKTRARTRGGDTSVDEKASRRVKVSKKVVREGEEKGEF